MSHPPAGPAGQAENLSKDALLQILQNQQQLMNKMAEQMNSMRLNSQTTLSSELILDSLSTNITEFVYDVDKGHSFNAWFSR